MQGIDHLEALPVGENKGHRRREVEDDSRRQRDKEIDRVQCMCECLQLVWSSRFRWCRKDL